MTNVQGESQRAGAKTEFDAVIIGAGFSGMYMLHSLRDKLDMTVTVFEAGDGVGGTWYLDGSYRQGRYYQGAVRDLCRRCSLYPQYAAV
jgi:cation diffusion facilitator CzcD-associated flavoprotein CzcO